MVKKSNIEYVSIRQHTSAFVSIRQHIVISMAKKSKIEHVGDKDICDSIRQHTSAYVSIRSRRAR
jgi:hypothetical protein